MAYHGTVRIVVAEDKLGDVSDVQIVGKAVASAIVVELTEFDQDGTVSAIGENAVLIVMKIAISDCKIGSLRPNASAIIVWDCRACEFDILNIRVTSRYHPDSFALRALAGGV